MAWAYDFEVPMHGYSLYFNIVEGEENAVEVTAPREDGITRWDGIPRPTGLLDIPSEVDHDGDNYRVVGIADRAFAGCSGITGIIFPPTLTHIGAFAFSQCTGLQGKVEITESIATIGNSAFYGCTGITEVEYNAVACDVMGGSIGTTAFGSCPSLQTISFGNRVRRIPAYAFAGMDGLNCKWSLPATLEYIGDYAFAYCSSIHGLLDIPEGVREIGSNAFAQCHLMNSLVLPSTTTRVGQRAFYQCVNVKWITVHALIPPEVEADAFVGIKGTVTLNVPCISAERYKKDENWKNFRTIKTVAPCTIEISGRVQDPEYGKVMGMGQYRHGDTAMLVAVCNSGYGFKSWTDGNTDNPRRVMVADTATYTAIMQPAGIMREIEYVHDTVHVNGTELVYEYYEINDVAEPMYTQEEIVYNSGRRRLEFEIDKRDLVEVTLYNEAGLCVYTGKPRRSYVNMRRYPTGHYIVRVSTFNDERVLRFFHDKNK